MKKKYALPSLAVLTALLALIVGVSFLPSLVRAEEGDEDNEPVEEVASYPLYIAGQQVDGENAEDLSVLNGVTVAEGGSISYDAESNTLYLDNVTISNEECDFDEGIEYFGNEDFSISVAGETYVLLDHSQYSYACGIEIVDQRLARMLDNVGDEEEKIADLDLQLDEGATLTVICKSADDEDRLSFGRGIFVPQNLTIFGSGSFVIDIEAEEVVGIYADADVKVLNTGASSITLIADDGFATGFEVYGGVTVSDADLTVEAKHINPEIFDCCIAIYAQNDLSISNSTVSASAYAEPGEAFLSYVHSLYSTYGKIDITGSFVTATAEAGYFAEPLYAECVRREKSEADTSSNSTPGIFISDNSTVEVKATAVWAIALTAENGMIVISDSEVSADAIGIEGSRSFFATFDGDESEAEGNIEISNSTVTANSTSPLQAYGLTAENDLLIEDSEVTVNASGNWVIAVNCYKSVHIDESRIKATAAAHEFNEEDLNGYDYKAKGDMTPFGSAISAQTITIEGKTSFVEAEGDTYAINAYSETKGDDIIAISEPLLIVIPEDGFVDYIEADHGEDGVDYVYFVADPAIEKEKDNSAKHALIKAKTVTVTFEVDGGSEIDPQEVIVGDPVEKPEDPTKDGYEFEGWFDDEELTQEHDFDEPVKDGESQILYAKWKKVEKSTDTEEQKETEAPKETPKETEAPKETAPAETTKVDIKYIIVSGGNGTHTKKSGKTFTIVIKRSDFDEECFKHFLRVMCDGKEWVVNTDYTGKAGSTIIEIKPETLDALSEGKHTLTFVFDDGQVETEIKIDPAPSAKPKTGDVGSSTGIWMILMTMSATAIVAIPVLNKKRKAE